MTERSAEYWRGRIDARAEMARERAAEHDREIKRLNDEAEDARRKMWLWIVCGVPPLLLAWAAAIASHN